MRTPSLARFGLLLVVLCGFSLCSQATEKLAPDFAGTHTYHDSSQALNSTALVKGRVVFIGDLITEGWGRFNPTFLDNVTRINLGISGQTTTQMLLRFRQDVLNLSPEVVVILAGTNDLAGNTGETTLTEITDNIASMADLATAHGSKVILCQLTPADHYGWAPEVKPVARMLELNAWIQSYAAHHGLTSVDLYRPMVIEEGRLNPRFSEDGVHPNAQGYALMTERLTHALNDVLAH